MLRECRNNKNVPEVLELWMMVVGLGTERYD